MNYYQNIRLLNLELIITYISVYKEEHYEYCCYGKNLKRTKLIIIFDLITIPLFLCLMLAVALPAIIGAATGSYEASIFAAVSTIILFVVVLIGFLVLGVLLLVYKILLTIYAFEFEEKIYGILMIVGFFVGIVGLVVLFLFYFYLKKKIEE